LKLEITSLILLAVMVAASFGSIQGSSRLGDRSSGISSGLFQLEENFDGRSINLNPIANSGPDKVVYEGEVVQFNGNKSEGGCAPEHWDIETVDVHGDLHTFASMALDSYDQPHISYFDSINGGLKYAKRIGLSWGIEKVDSTVQAGEFTSIAIDSSGYPHISYFDRTDHDLRYAKWNGSVWVIEIVDSAGWVGEYSSLALDSSDCPHISYFDFGNRDLKYAMCDGDSWQIETVDFAGSVGSWCSLKLDQNDWPHISYLDSGHSYLKYAKWNGSSWKIETVDSTDTIYDYSSIALDSDNFPHISYYREYGRDLKYARWNGTCWDIEIVDSAGTVGMLSSLVIDSHNLPHISYCDHSNDTLKYARRTGSSWIFQVVAPMTDRFWSPTPIALDSNNLPHICYDYLQDIKYAKLLCGETSIISYEWDFDADVDSDGDGNSTNDTDATGPTSTHVYGDDGVYTVTLTVTDEQGLSDTDTCNITVLNIDPTATIESTTMDVEFGLRVAGRKYNNVSMTLYENGNSLGSVSIERLPGSPNVQMAWVPVSIDFSKSYSANVTFTSKDPPNIGGNPVWIYLKSKDGSIKKIHHTFNVQQSKKRDSEHWNHVEPWEVDLSAYLIGLPFEIISHVTDPGSDDETLTFTYGSQVKIVTYLNNPPNPDPYPSPKVNAVDIMDMTTLVYEGSGTVTLVVKDDDNIRLGVGEGSYFMSVGLRT